MTQPDAKEPASFNADGEPDNLPAALMDAIEWLGVMQGWMMVNRPPTASHEMWADSQARLRRCVNALKHHIEPYIVCPVEVKDV